MNVQRSFAGDGTGQPGLLYLVATPIGNLEDITYRAVRTLREVDWIAAEDTRQTRKLLAHYDIRTRLVSYHEHNKRARGPELIEKLLSGQSVALVSDAGMPAISDPGEELVAEAVRQGIAVVPVPGANAALSALIASGLSAAAFRFAGFLPRDKQKRDALLQELARTPDTLLLYEAPHRLAKTLGALREHFGDRRIALARELTKKHEEIARGRLSEALAWLEQHPPRGEYCIVVEGRTEEAPSAAAGEPWWADMDAAGHVAAYEAQGLGRKEAIKRAALDRGVPKREVYNALLGGKSAEKAPAED